MLRGWGCIVLTTWKFRIKEGGSASKTLGRMARSVNTVWNFAKAAQRDALKAKSARLIVDKKTGKEVSIPNFRSAYELQSLTAGSSKELGIHSHTIQATLEEYVTRRKQFKKLLRWRGRKSLGWVPFTASGIKWSETEITYFGKRFRYWNSRSLPEDAVIKCGSFSQDARGRWYISIVFASESLSFAKGVADVGIDPGVKTLATISDGTKIERPNLRARFLEKMKRLERTRKFARRRQSKTKQSGLLPKARQFTNLHAQVANARADYLHKESTKLVQRTNTIVMGDLSCRFLNRNSKLSGISLDSGLGMFRGMLRYKAKRAGATYVEVSERDSTQTCSSCGWQHPKEKRIGLGVRQWTCGGCAVEHDRDINAARNILAAYRPSPAQDVVRCPSSPPFRRRKPRESSASKQEHTANV
jgi:putative transposase